MLLSGANRIYYQKIVPVCSDQQPVFLFIPLKPLDTVNTGPRFEMGRILILKLLQFCGGREIIIIIKKLKHLLQISFFKMAPSLWKRFNKDLSNIWKSNRLQLNVEIIWGKFVFYWTILCLMKKWVVTVGLKHVSWGLIIWEPPSLIFPCFLTPTSAEEMLKKW